MADGDVILSTSDGVRELKYKNSDYQVLEVGENSLRGFSGNPPRGRETYIAARRSRGSQYGSVVIRILGTLSLAQNDSRYNPKPGDQVHWMSRRILKSDAESRLFPFRFNEGGGGNAFPGDTGHPEDYLDHPEEFDQSLFANPYIQRVSELSGWNWERIDTVQFLSEPEPKNG